MKQYQQSISMNDLSDWSPWPARLMGQSAWTPTERSIVKVESEYNQDKYARCLTFCQQRQETEPGAVKRFELGDEPDRQVCISQGDTLWSVSIREAYNDYQAILFETMREAIQEADVIIELGCGYGFNLWQLHAQFPEKRYLGGEYSQNAVLVAEQLYQKFPQIRVEAFNYYDPQYRILHENLRGAKAVVFTAHSVEQIPKASHIINTLSSYRESDVTFFHFEPAYELHQDNLLGLMRRRYAELNDYNRDLVSCLRACSGISLQMEADLFGINPLNATSALSWQFQK